MHQMDSAQPLAKLYKLPKALGVGGIGHAGEVCFEKLLVFFAIAWAMEYGVDVVEQVDGGEGVWLVALFGGESESQAFGDFFDDGHVEIGRAFLGQGIVIGVEIEGSLLHNSLCTVMISIVYYMFCNCYTIPMTIG